MSSDPKDIDIAFADQIVMPDNLAIDIIDFKTAVVRFDSICDLW